MLERMKPILAVSENAVAPFHFPAPEELAPPLVTFENAVVGYDGLPVLKNLNLRLDQDDRIALADGRMISPSVLTHPFKPMHSVEESQIVQEAYDHIVIRIKPNAQFTEAERDHLVREFRVRLGQDVRVDVEVVERIPRTASGKFKWVISKVERAIQVQ